MQKVHDPTIDFDPTRPVYPTLVRFCILTIECTYRAWKCHLLLFSYILHYIIFLHTHTHRHIQTHTNTIDTIIENTTHGVTMLLCLIINGERLLQYYGPIILEKWDKVTGVSVWFLMYLYHIDVVWWYIRLRKSSRYTHTDTKYVRKYVTYCNVSFIRVYLWHW